ncbi:TatD family hydrolase [Virgibacillus ainsalahensis]
MYKPIIDAHIHLDVYQEAERNRIIQDMGKNDVEFLVAVSNHLQSAHANLTLARENPGIKTAFGFHPEQPLPSEEEKKKLHQFMERYQQEMVAVGEVGLPYYLRKENPGMPLDPYVEMLEEFIIVAKKLDKPIALHAVYEDAPVVCTLLEKHSVKKAHFHWFKGDFKTVQRIIQNGYFISITPDVLYKKKIQELVKHYPISQMMVETDGPWPFEGPFQNCMTHPKMIHQTIRRISEIKQMNIRDVYERIHLNTINFYF